MGLPFPIPYFVSLFVVTVMVSRVWLSMSEAGTSQKSTSGPPHPHLAGVALSSGHDQERKTQGLNPAVPTTTWLSHLGQVMLPSGPLFLPLWDEKQDCLPLVLRF